MSSKTVKHVTMKVVVSSLNEEDAFSIQKELSSFLPGLGYSPCRAEPSLNDAIEFLASGTCDEVQKDFLIHTLNNDFDHDENDTEFWAYGFNTRMFNPLVYYLSMDFS
ncbi:hypothetical protein [Ileibacterium valens]|uniref:hypothetical protein n=2 Tax=Ileibacterium valens TaxID=1862668 RepID=UPI0023575278|nr:hypothetical protein [Ileibacterium valens]